MKEANNDVTMGEGKMKKRKAGKERRQIRKTENKIERRKNE